MNQVKPGEIYMDKIKNTFNCLKQLIEKNIYKEPKCYVCKNTKFTCGHAVLIILILFAII